MILLSTKKKWYIIFHKKYDNKILGRPGQPNWDFEYGIPAQCRNLAIFLPLLFYVKSLLADFRRSKIAVFTFL